MTTPPPQPPAQPRPVVPPRATDIDRFARAVVLRLPGLPRSRQAAARNALVSLMTVAAVVQAAQLQEVPRES